MNSYCSTREALFFSLLPELNSSDDGRFQGGTEWQDNPVRMREAIRHSPILWCFAGPTETFLAENWCSQGAGEGGLAVIYVSSWTLHCRATHWEFRTKKIQVKAKRGIGTECCGNAGAGRKMWTDVRRKDKKTWMSGLLPWLRTHPES